MHRRSMDAMLQKVVAVPLFSLTHSQAVALGLQLAPGAARKAAVVWAIAGSRCPGRRAGAAGAQTFVQAAAAASVQQQVCDRASLCLLLSARVTAAGC